MAKQSGLGDNLWIGGVDLSGDISSLGNVGGGPALLELTGIDKSAYERTGGLRTGAIEMDTWFNPATGKAHRTLGALPTADVLITYARGVGYGAPAACLNAKQPNYDGSRGDDGAFTFAVASVSNAYGLEWTDQLTNGRVTLTGAGSTTGVDFDTILGSVGTLSFGMQAYLHVFGFTGTSATINVQSSTDNAVGDAYATISGGSFSAVTSGPQFQRIETGRTTAIERWLRVNVTGTFSSLDFAVMVQKNICDTVF
jgi:hypothetical protein